MFDTITLFCDKSPFYANLFPAGKVSRAWLCKAPSSRLFQRRLNFEPEDCPAELQARRFTEEACAGNVFKLDGG